MASLETRIFNNYAMREYEIWISQNHGFHTDILEWDKNENCFTWSKYDPNSANVVKPTLRIPEWIAKEIVNALNTEGIKPDLESKNEGRLEATKYHLDDLRNLLRLK